jgi:hypothetical protein
MSIKIKKNGTQKTYKDARCFNKGGRKGQKEGEKCMQVKQTCLRTAAGLGDLQSWAVAVQIF